MKTECKVHKFINVSALRILRNDGFCGEYEFFCRYIADLNEGAVWADQDFKSSNHFYNPYNKKAALYGRKSAMELGTCYYRRALSLWRIRDFTCAMFYLGAALHIIQDMTVPQHANIRLLDDHRQFETFVKHTYKFVDEFNVQHGAYELHSIRAFIKFNARTAISIYKRYRRIPEDTERFYSIARCAIPLAKRTTAGAMLMFYHDLFPSETRGRLVARK